MIGILQRIQRRHKGKKSALSGRLGRVKRIWKQRYLVLLALPGFIYLIIFKYVPIFGVQIAFKDYMFRRGILGSEWVGLKHFDQLFHDITVVPTVINTLGISILKILICFPLPILFALLLNEVRSNRFKRFVQTASYLPHFISYSVVALMLSTLLSRTGVVNSVLVSIGLLKEPYLFLGEANAFWWVVVWSEAWKSIGWDSIIYFSALTAVPPELYEAAIVDGAKRFQRMIHVTLPCLKPTILMLFIMRVGNVVTAANFDLSYLLSNPLNVERAEILSTYILKTGIELGRFSYATAVGFVQAATSLILVILANKIVKKASGEGLF